MSDLPGTLMNNGACIGFIKEFRKTMPPGFQRDLLELSLLSQGGINWSSYVQSSNISGFPFVFNPNNGLETHEQQLARHQNRIEQANQDLRYVHWLMAKVEDGLHAKIVKHIDEVFAEIDNINRRIFREIDVIEDRVFAEVKMLRLELADNNSAIKRDIVKYHNEISEGDLSFYILIGQITIAFMFICMGVIYYTTAKKNDTPINTYRIDV